jgi:hypothetical protein
MSGRGVWWVLPFAYLLVHYSVAALRTSVEQRKPGRVVIPIAPSTRIFLLILYPLYMGVGAVMMWGPRGSSDWWGAPIVWSLGVLTAAFGPRSIYLDDKALRQRSWLGAPKEILWREVHSVVIGKNGAVIVTGKGGTIIRHNLFHTERERFLSEIERRSGFVAHGPRFNDD